MAIQLVGIAANIGLVKRLPVELTNDSGSTLDAAGCVSGDLGTENDEAFRRGREWRRKGYSRNASRAAVKGKSSAYRKSFFSGWQWQDRV